MTIRSKGVVKSSQVGESVIESINQAVRVEKRKFEPVSGSLVRTTSAYAPKRVFVRTCSESQLLSSSGSDAKIESEPNLTIPWRKIALTKGKALQEMIANSKKAIEEHKEAEGPVESSIYASYQTMESRATSSPVALRCKVAEKQGIRPSMEDAHFFKKTPEGYVAGIFDGHGGEGVAKTAAEMFPSIFSKTLKAADGHVHRALEATINQIHQEVIQKRSLRYVGSTAAVSFIKENGEIYTATVGDSEVFRYTKDEDGNFKSTPLSCVRDWSDPGEVKRASMLAVTDTEKERVKNWGAISNPKMRRIRNVGGYSLNLSRSIGDPTYTQVSQKPEITIDRLKKGDKIGFLCDGVTDFVSQEEVVGLMQNRAFGDLAEKVTNFAIQSKRSTDNVTAMFLHVCKK